jgi:DNA-binding NarL/FixJ family response regulator
MEMGETVLIADEDEQSRGRLAQLLRSAGYGVLETDRGDETLELARTRYPAAVVTEIPLAGLCGYEICHLLKSEPGIQVPVVFLTGARTEPYDRIAGLLLKADDYIVKPYAAGELLARLANLIRRSQSRESSPASRLTKREEEVLELMVDGLRHGEIARRLFISPKTVATHVEHILRKLGVRSKTEAVIVAYREQIVRPRVAHAPSHAGPPEEPSREPGRAPRRFR